MWSSSRPQSFVTHPRAHLALLRHDAGPQLLNLDVEVGDLPAAVEEVTPIGACLGAAFGELQGDRRGGYLQVICAHLLQQQRDR